MSLSQIAFEERTNDSERGTEPVAQNMPANQYSSWQHRFRTVHMHGDTRAVTLMHHTFLLSNRELDMRYNRQGRKTNVGAGTATATEPTREHKQYATQGPTTYLCT